MSRPGEPVPPGGARSAAEGAAGDPSRPGPPGANPMPGTPAGTAPPGGPPAESSAGPDARPAVRARRFWSARRVPSAITAALLLGGAGLLLYDVAAVRTGHPAMPWRVELARQLATRPLDDPWVITGAAVAALLGLWLVALALSPGLRQVLPMRPGPGLVRAGLDRQAVALVLRDRALDVPGVRSVRVAVGRRRARVRADSHFRELDAVRRDLETELREVGRGLALARPLRLALRVRRAGKG